MYQQIPWTTELMENFIKYGNLTDREIEVLKLRVKEEKIYRIAMEINRGEATVSRIIKSINTKYDRCQKTHPELFPRRETCRTAYVQYKNFVGMLQTNQEDTFMDFPKYIDFTGKEFNSFQEIRDYIKTTVEDNYDCNLAEVGNLHVKMKMELDVCITKK